MRIGSQNNLKRKSATHLIAKRFTYLTFLLVFLLTSGCIFLNKYRCNISNENWEPNQLQDLINKVQPDVLVSQLDIQLANLNAREKYFDLKRLYLCLFTARILEQRQNYQLAADIYERGIEFLKSESTTEKLDLRVLYSLKAIFLYRLCFCCIQLGNYHRVSQLTANYTCPELDDQEKYYLVKGCFSLVHLFHTGDYERMYEVLNVFRDTLRSKERVSILHPFTYLERMLDEAFVNILLAYAQIHFGALDSASRLQYELERVYHKPYIKILLWGGQTLGVFRQERAIILGFGGYGYSLLGRYHKSQHFFLKALNCLNRQISGSKRERLVLGGLHIAYADRYLIPMKKYRDADHHIRVGQNILNRIRYDQTLISLLDTDDFWLNHLFKPYGYLVSAKLNFREKRFENCLTDTREALKLLERASPKQLIVDAIYFGFLSKEEEPSGNKSTLDFGFFLKESKDKLEGYKGYEVWKIYYMKSLVYEQENALHKALEAAKQSLEIVEKFWLRRFPEITQQVAFMEDKTLPYTRTIDLLIRLELPPRKKQSEIFKYIEKVKSHSLQIQRTNLRNQEDNLTNLEPDLTRLQHILSDDEAVIELYYGTNHLISLYISSEEIYLERSEISEQEMDGIIDTFTKYTTWEGTWNRKNFLLKGLDIFSKILGCHRAKLDSKKKIYIVPHRKLHYLPWNALTMSLANYGNNYLIDRYAVSIIPSAATLIDAQNIGDRRSKDLAHNCAFFVGAGMKFHSSCMEELQSLGCCKIYPAERTNVDSVITELFEARTLVLYAHGRFDPSSPFDPAESFVELAGRGPNSKLTLAHLEKAHIVSDFVILAGCDTGTVGRYSELPIETQHELFREADDLLGIYTTLLTRGVPCMVISLQETQQKRSAEHFLVNIIRYLEKGLSERDAFRAAILELKRDCPEPYYWSPYIYVGI
jgi:CHAT domain-containing protein